MLDYHLLATKERRITEELEFPTTCNELFICITENILVTYGNQLFAEERGNLRLRAGSVGIAASVAVL
jgi:hypothetical protein